MAQEHVLTIFGIDLGKKALTLKYYDIKNALADGYYRDYFDDWSTDHKRISLWSKDKKIAAILDYNRLVFSAEHTANINELLEIAKGLTKEFCSQLEISHVERIGHRVVSIAPVREEFDTFVRKLEPRFYPVSEQLHTIAGEHFADVAFIVDFNKYGFLNHVVLGPVRDTEIKEKLKGSVNFLDDVKLPPVSLFIDIDVSRKAFDIAGLESFFEDAPKAIATLTEEFANFAIS